MDYNFHCCSEKSQTLLAKLHGPLRVHKPSFANDRSRRQTRETRLLLADFLLAPAVEVIVQTLGRVARFITLAVVEDAPAVPISAVCPWVHGQRAVPTVPFACERVALLVADAVVGLAMAVRQWAAGHQDSSFLLAAFTMPFW